MRQKLKADSVAISGSLLGIASLFIGWLTLKPSRIAAGVSLDMYRSLGAAGAVIIMLLWLACLFLSFAVREKRTAVFLGIAASLSIILAFFFAGLAARQLLAGQPEIARVSPGAGIWLSVFAGYVVIYAARKQLEVFPVWRNPVTWSAPVVVLILFVTGWLNALSIVQEFHTRQARFYQELLNHIALVGVSVAVGAVLGVLLGIWAARSRSAEKPIFFIVSITQTIPSLALFGLLIAPLSVLSFAFPALRELGIRGVGTAPALIALVVYSLLPIVRNTYVGLRQVEPAVIDAGRGMGMSASQIFRRIEAPLSAPIVLEGVRTATVQSVGLAAVAALIGAGGLGWFIFQGLGQAAGDLILLGALPIILLAVIADAVMRLVIRLATPAALAGGRP